MVSTTKVSKDKSPIYPMTSTPIKKPSARKSVCLFTNIFEANKTAYRRVGAAKYNHKAIKFGNKPFSLKQKAKREFRN